MIFDAIRESHDLQRDLCRKLTASRRDMAARQVLFLQSKVELMAHAAAEERHLYVPLLMEDGGLDASRHALHEHHEVDELLDDLSVRNQKQAGWIATARGALSQSLHFYAQTPEPNIGGLTRRDSDQVLWTPLTLRPGEKRHGLLPDGIEPESVADGSFIVCRNTDVGPDKLVRITRVRRDPAGLWTGKCSLEMRELNFAFTATSGESSLDASRRFTPREAPDAKSGTTRRNPAGGAPSSSSTSEARIAILYAERTWKKKPVQVFRSQGDLYKVLDGGDIYYVDPDVNFIIIGRMYNFRTREDLTKKRLDTAR